MTREEAIDNLQDLWNEVYNEDSDGYDYAQAIDMAIEALSKPNYETDTEVRLAVTNRNKDKVVLWDAFGEVEYYPNGEINCVHNGRVYEDGTLEVKVKDAKYIGRVLVLSEAHNGGLFYPETEPENEYLEPTQTHGRLIDADALAKLLFDISKEYEDAIENEKILVQGAIRRCRHAVVNAPTVTVVDITQRDLCKDISCTDCPFMKETCKLMDYVADAEAVQGEWTDIDDYYRMATCSRCHKVTMFEKWGEYTKPYDFCPNCGARMKGGEDE